MDVLAKMGLGFSVALEPINLLICFIGVFFGTLVGVLPGLGPIGALALLLPITFKMSPIAGIIMLAGIYYGAMYGGSTTSILVNIPGEAASVVTCLDGYKMARQGRAGPALGNFGSKPPSKASGRSTGWLRYRRQFRFGASGSLRGVQGGCQGWMSLPVSSECD